MARILLIDDESNIRMMARLALQHVGHTVEVASDGAEGLDKFGDGSAWELVLLDHRMPGITGLEALREMRSRAPQARVVIITAFGTIDLAAEAMAAGATDFLRKPFTVDMLRQTVEAALKPVAIDPSHRTKRYGSTILNGFQVVAEPDRSLSGASHQGEIRWLFAVRGPHGEIRDCAVLLPGFVVDHIRSHAPQLVNSDGDRLWGAVCEDALANYVWQNAEFPPDQLLRVSEVTASMRRCLEALETSQPNHFHQ